MSWSRKRPHVDGTYFAVYRLTNGDGEHFDNVVIVELTGDHVRSTCVYESGEDLVSEEDAQFVRFYYPAIVYPEFPGDLI